MRYITIILLIIIYFTCERKRKYIQKTESDFCTEWKKRGKIDTWQNWMFGALYLSTIIVILSVGNYFSFSTKAECLEKERCEVQKEEIVEYKCITLCSPDFLTYPFSNEPECNEFCEKVNMAR